MSDIFSPTQRHANMAAIHGKNTNYKPTTLLSIVSGIFVLQNCHILILRFCRNNNYCLYPNYLHNQLEIRKH